VLLPVFVLLALLQASALAEYPEIRFEAATIEYEKNRAKDVRLKLGRGGHFTLQAEQLHLEGAGGEVSGLLLEGKVDEAFATDDAFTLRGTASSRGVAAGFEILAGADVLTAEMSVNDQDVLLLRSLAELPAEFDWISRGNLDARLRYSGFADNAGEISLFLALKGVAFDSPDGRFASEALGLEVSAGMSMDDMSSMTVRGSVQRGEVLIDDFYRDFSDGGLEFGLQPCWKDGALELRSIRVTDHHALSFEGSASYVQGRPAGSLVAEVHRLDLAFPGAYERYIEAPAAAWTLNGLGVTGRVSWKGTWSAGSFSSGDLKVTDLSIVDTRRERFAVTGISAHLRPGDHAFHSRLEWRGMLLGRLNLGAGDVALDSEPGVFAIVDPLQLHMLGGSLFLDELKVLLPGIAETESAEPDIKLKARLDKLNMLQVTAALGWPSFEGEISGDIPGVQLQDGVLDVAGEILINVFDGSLSLQDLRIERPFGVLPSLAANLEIKDLDLEQVTSTFSFGQISGRLDGYIRELRMLDWQPVAFDAWLGTPERQRGSNDISRRAVSHLTTLGGGSATTALTSPVLRLFNNFSYRRIGLGCRMQNNVCDVRGVSEDDVSVLIMEGAGVPKITIRAFNRRVDWPQLVAHLKAATAGNPARVGD
jgi:hypothetical protein